MSRLNKTVATLAKNFILNFVKYMVNHLYGLSIIVTNNICKDDLNS